MDGLIETPTVSNPSDCGQVNINPDLIFMQKEQVRNIIHEFAGTLTNRPNLMDHNIELTTDTPVRVKHYPSTHSMENVVVGAVRTM